MIVTFLHMGTEGSGLPDVTQDVSRTVKPWTQVFRSIALPWRTSKSHVRKIVGIPYTRVQKVLCTFPEGESVFVRFPAGSTDDRNNEPALTSCKRQTAESNLSILLQPYFYLKESCSPQRG